MSFAEAKLTRRKEQLDLFFVAFAEWATHRCKDGVNLFDPACEQDPNGIVVQFFSGNFSLTLTEYLWDAASSGNLERVQSAVAAGADVNAVGKDEVIPGTYTALYLACLEGCLPVAEYLLDAGAKVETPGAGEITGRSALHCAVDGDHAMLVKLLLDRGVDHTRQDDDGLTALALAQRHEMDECVELLKSTQAQLAQKPPQACTLGLEKLPDDDINRVYRDTHRVVLQAKAPYSGYVHAVRLQFHELPAGRADGTGWDVCSYSTLDGDMGEKHGRLREETRQPIRVDRQARDEQVVNVTPPLWMEEGEYVGIQNSSSELCDGWEASWGGAGTGGMCLSLDDHSDHGQYIWKFDGGMASEPDSRLLNTTGRLKERHVGFCAILTYAKVGGGGEGCGTGDVELLKSAQAQLMYEQEQSELLRTAKRQLNTCKLGVVGDGRVGKTSLLTVLRGLDFNDEEESTCGVDTCTIDVREEAWFTNESGADSFEEKMAGALIQASEATEPEPEPEPELKPPSRRALPPTEKNDTQAEVQFCIARPPSAARIGLGRTAFFETHVECAAECTAQWYKDGEKSALTATSTPRMSTPGQLFKLTIEDAQESDVGSYHCVVESGSVQLETPAVALELVESVPVKFVQQPVAELWLDDTKEDSLAVRATGGLAEELAGRTRPEDLQYQWFQNDVKLGKGSTCSGLSLQASSDAAGMYFVEVWCESQADPVRSDKAKVNVTGLGIMSKVLAIMKEKGASLTEDSPKVVVTDFAGQRMYYVLHQIVLTEALTMYVVAVSLEYDLDDKLTGEDFHSGLTHGENLDFWLGSIHGCAPGANVLIVCTKMDLVDEAVRERRVAAVEASLRGTAYENQVLNIVCVSAKDGTGVEEVREALQAQAKPFDGCNGLVRYGDRVPLGWFKFLSIAKELCGRGERRITLQAAAQIGSECQITDPVELQRMLQEYHDIGLLLWHDQEDTRDLVVLDLQWMLDTMTEMLCRRSIADKKKTAGLRSLWTRLEEEGRLSSLLLPELWPTLDESERKSMLVYMERFGHCVKLPAEICTDEPIWVIPTLLPALAESAEPPWHSQDSDYELCIRFIHTDGEWEIPWSDSSHGFMPDTMFFRLVAMLVSRARTIKDAFKDMYSDRIVVRGEHRYMLRHHRAEHLLRLTVSMDGQDGSSLAQVAQMLKHALMGLQTHFGVQFRFELECEWQHERGHWPLDYLPEGHKLAAMWQPGYVATAPTSTLAASDASLGVGDRSAPPLASGKRWHFFICHHQGSGGDQANTLCIRLERLGYRVWYDNGQKADHRNLEGMKTGVRESECLLVFLSGRKETNGQPDINGVYEGPFTRWFCHEEMATAHAEGLRCVGVMETDPRHGQPDFVLEKSRARTGGKGGAPVHDKFVEQNLKLLDKICFIPLRRQEHEVQAMLTEITRQAEVAKRLVSVPVPVGVEPALDAPPEHPLRHTHTPQASPLAEPGPEPEPQSQLPEGTPPVTHLQTVEAWLTSIGLAKYADQVKDYGYDQLRILLDASEDDIKEMTEDKDVRMKRPARRTMLVQWKKLVEDSA